MSDRLALSLSLSGRWKKRRRRREEGCRGWDGWWHHRLNGHELGQTPGDGEGQGSLACYSPRGRKEADTTEWLNNTTIRRWNSFLDCRSEQELELSSIIQSPQIAGILWVSTGQASGSMSQGPCGDMGSWASQMSQPGPFRSRKDWSACPQEPSGTVERAPPSTKFLWGL